MLGASRAQGSNMAYRNSYNYKGGSKKVRDSRRVKRGLRLAGWIALWLFVGMLVTHLIFSVASESSSRLAELSSGGIPPITTRMDEVNSQYTTACWCGSSFSDSYNTDLLIATLKRKGITKAVLDIKTESGRLAYASNVATARRVGAISDGAPDLDRILVKFSNAGIGVIARVSLYIDDAAATDVKHCAVESREVTETVTDDEGNVKTVAKKQKVDSIWRDKNGHAWRSPFDSGAVEYASELLVELAQGGVEAVLVDNVRFPTTVDGNEGNVIFPEEEASDTSRSKYSASELPRAGAIRQNIQQLYSAAKSAGVKLYVGLDAPFCCGTQDERAGITFNVFGLDADVICPIAIVSRFEANSAIGDYAFTDAQSVDLTSLFESICSGVHMMQGAVDEPPAAMPFIQAYSDTATGFIMTADSLKAQTSVLDKNLIPGRVLYGTAADFEVLLTDVGAEEAGSSEQEAAPEYESSEPEPPESDSSKSDSSRSESSKQESKSESQSSKQETPPEPESTEPETPPEPEPTEPETQPEE